MRQEDELIALVEMVEMVEMVERVAPTKLCTQDSAGERRLCTYGFVDLPVAQFHGRPSNESAALSNVTTSLQSGPRPDGSYRSRTCPWYSDRSFAYTEGAA